MALPVQTNVTELPDSRVRVAVQVEPDQVQARVERAARELGRELKLPGFRKGKVPAALVLQRLGREAVLEQAVRDGLGGWYVEAIRTSEIVPVGDPKIDLGELPGPGAAFQFSFEIGVLPRAELGQYLDLEVGRREPQADEEQIERQIEAMRDRLARLETVERAAELGDHVVVDYTGRLPTIEDETGETTFVPFAGGEGRDQLIELGSGNLIPGFEEGLLGARAGEDPRTVEVTFPGDYPNEELAGRQATFEIDVKEVKHKQLPALDEDFAADAGFDDVDELREDIRSKLLAEDERHVSEEFREAALDAAVAAAKVHVTAELARARAQEMWERMLHSLSHRGISRESYLRLAGRPEEEILTETIPDAERALRREAVLTAVVAAEQIEPSEEDLLEYLTPAAEREQVEPAEALEKLRADGRLEELREDLAARQAVDLIVERAVPIPADQAAAREKLWTPEKEAAAVGEPAGAGAGGSGAGGGLWTPGDAGSAR
ncbi:MAG TPA: trigger factor [Solirubrobacteraceae bacterium]|nr:trigger factor [Solirubrobacteraceae bacterium]